MPMRTSARIKSLIRRDDTLQRLHVRGTSQLTWAKAGYQLASLSDGVNLTDPPTKAFHSQVYVLKGDPAHATFEETPGYPDIIMRWHQPEHAAFWGASCLAVDDRIYQFLMTTNHSIMKSDMTPWPGFRAVGAKLIYSPDQGVTWNNQDGSHPVVWERWEARSRENMAFFNEEPGGAFAWPIFLQMGKGYEANQDGYVYVYSTNGGFEGTANQLVLLRVPKSRVLERQSYEFFGGWLSSGEASWTQDIEKRAVVHTFPEGWVSRADQDGMIPMGWNANVVYNEGLGLYMMMGQGTGVAAGGEWFGKPSYLGFWVAPHPWGPFKQIHEEKAWTPGNDVAARAFMPQIAPKWISPDGKSFWLVWSDYRYQGNEGETVNPDGDWFALSKDIKDDAEFARGMFEWAKTHMPGGFKTQRFDLVVE